MEERRRIVIPTGVEPPVLHSTPHFDEEATLAARRVVPLGPRTDRAGKSPARRILIFATVIAAAAGIGVACGFVLAALHGNSGAQPAPVATNGSASQTSSTPESSQPAPAASQETSPGTNPSTTASQSPATPPGNTATPAGNSSERDSGGASTDARQNDNPPNASYSNSTRRSNAESERPREARDRRRPSQPNRPARERQDRSGDERVRPPVRGAGDQLNRIREIFEGVRP